MDWQNLGAKKKTPKHQKKHQSTTKGSTDDTDPDYWKGEEFAYVGLPQNLKDLRKGVSLGYVRLG